MRACVAFACAFACAYAVAARDGGDGGYKARRRPAVTFTNASVGTDTFDGQNPSVDVFIRMPYYTQERVLPILSVGDCARIALHGWTDAGVPSCSNVEPVRTALRARSAVAAYETIFGQARPTRANRTHLLDRRYWRYPEPVDSAIFGTHPPRLLPDGRIEYRIDTNLFELQQCRYGAQHQHPAVSKKGEVTLFVTLVRPETTDTFEALSTAPYYQSTCYKRRYVIQTSAPRLKPPPSTTRSLQHTTSTSTTTTLAHEPPATPQPDHRYRTHIGIGRQYVFLLAVLFLVGGGAMCCC